LFTAKPVNEYELLNNTPLANVVVLPTSVYEYAKVFPERKAKSADPVVKPGVVPTNVATGL